MKILISEKVKHKLKTKHNVTVEEVYECFERWTKETVTDDRKQNQSIPPTEWFIAETNTGKKLKIVFIPTLDYEVMTLKTAYPPNKKKGGLMLKIGRLEDYSDILGIDVEKFNEEAELWDSRKLGASAKHTKRVPKENEDAMEKALNKALGSELVIFRLKKSLIKQLNKLAKLEGLGYQTLARDIFTRYVEDNEHKLEKKPKKKTPLTQITTLSKKQSKTKNNKKYKKAV